jgi:RNA polymerase sigma factor (TIGR02999 family)
LAGRVWHETSNGNQIVQVVATATGSQYVIRDKSGATASDTAVIEPGTHGRFTRARLSPDGSRLLVLSSPPKLYDVKTGLLEAADRGDPHAAAELLPLVYDELRKLATARLARERPGHTLDATALVHEAYLRLVGRARRASDGPAQFDGRGHFFVAAAEAMRRILVENARRKKAAKNGGTRGREELHPDIVAAPAPEDELLAVHEALDRLAENQPEKAELVKLRYFAGLTADEAATALGISPSTADRYWVYARAWLRREIGRSTTG